MRFPSLHGRLMAAGLALCTGLPVHALSLAEAQRAAWQHHPDLALAANARQAAAADVTTAGQAPNPILSVQTVNIDPQRGVGAGPAWRQAVDTTVGVSWQIERGNKRGLRVAGGEALQLASRADLAETRRQVQLAVTLAYYELKRTEERQQLVEASLALQQRGFDIAQRRVQAGDLASIELARLQVELSRAQAERAQAEADRLLARRGLAAAMGLEAPRADELSVLQADDPYPLPPPAAPTPETADPVALQRPDVRAAEQRVQAARLQRDLADAATHRDVTVGVSAERFPPDMRGSLGLSLSVPLFLNHRYEGERRHAELGIEAAELALRKQRQLALLDARQAADQWEAARARLQSLEGPAQQAAQQALAGIELAHARGAAALTDLLDARRQLHALQLDVVDARANHAKALASLQATAQADPRWDE